MSDIVIETGERTPILHKNVWKIVKIMNIVKKLSGIFKKILKMLGNLFVVCSPLVLSNVNGTAVNTPDQHEVNLLSVRGLFVDLRKINLIALLEKIHQLIVNIRKSLMKKFLI